MDEMFERDRELRILPAGDVMRSKNCHSDCCPVQRAFMGTALSIFHVTTTAK
jgi:hypothetical protein